MKAILKVRVLFRPMEGRTLWSRRRLRSLEQSHHHPCSKSNSTRIGEGQAASHRVGTLLPAPR